MDFYDFEKILQHVNEAGVHLEIVGGLPLWEMHPAMRHQEAVDQIRASIKPNPTQETPVCACVHLADVYIRFADNSFMRPDISIFCRRPDEEDTAITLIPEAVIEIISKGYEMKDLEIAPRFYLSQGIKDVVVLDPYTLTVWHFRRDGIQQHHSPTALTLECGCGCVV